MSRLDSVIRRLTAQRLCIDYMAELISEAQGPILEIGLGNGRTYDHLRETFPTREVYAFDRSIQAHATCIPAAEQMIVGEIRETLPFCGPRIKQKAVLAHADLGQGDPTMTLSIDAWLSPMLAEHIVPGGVILSNQVLTLPGWSPVDLPKDVPEGRYFCYQKP
jgi:hypothetical protein